MLAIKDKSINAWQAGILMFILMFANKLLVLPSLLYENAGVEAYIIPIILFAFETGLVFLFYKLKTAFPNESFAEIIKYHFGKIVFYVLYIFFMIFFLCKALLIYNVTYLFFKNVIYKEANNLMYLVCFLPVVNHLAVSGIRVIGRTAQLFFPIICVVATFCLVIGIFGINGTPLLFDATLPNIALTSLRHVSAFGDAVILFLLMDKIKIKKGQWKTLFSLTAVAMVLASAVTVIFIFSYTYTSFMHPFAIFEIMSFIREYGGLGRIDIISMVFVVLLTYFHFALYLKGYLLAFDLLFPKIDDIYSVLSFNFAFVIIINFVLKNLEGTIFYGEYFLPYFSILPFVLVPLFCAILLFKVYKKERK